MRPTPESIIAAARSFQTSRILLTAVQLGVFEALDKGPKTAGQAARALKAAPRGAERLLSALCAMGYLRKRGGRFSNTPVSARHLVPGKPGYLGMLGHSAWLWHSWSTLTPAVRRGGSVYERPAGRHAEARTRAFIEAMDSRARREAPELARRLKLKEVSRVLDIGGGSGVFSRAMARAEPRLEAVVFDLPAVVPIARKFIREDGLADRIVVKAGDYNKGGFGKGFDLVLLSAILHSNSPAQNKALLKRAAAALKPGGRIAITEFVVDEGRVSPPQAVFFALNMLVNTEGGDTYTFKEISSWLRAAGCAAIRMEPTGSAAKLLLARKTGRTGRRP